jgi:hypothetical protein
MSRSTKSTGHKSVTALNREFERTLAAFKALTPSEDSPEGHKRWERALDRVDKIARHIVTTRAKTIEEMRIKTRVIAWEVRGAEVPYLSKWQPRRLDSTFEVRALIALSHDLDWIAKRLNVEAA